MLEHTYKMYPISIHSEICKNHRCHKLCVTNSFKAVANYVCKLYRGEVNPHNVDHLRMDFFSHKMKDVDRLPPTSDALH